MSATDASAAAAEQFELVTFDSNLERESQLKEAYGEGQFDQVLKFDEELLKAEWEAYNHKVKLLDPIYKRRSEFVKKIPGFWLQVLTNDPACHHHVDAIDRDALSHLEDLTIDHDPNDARSVTFHFHFAKGNPYFSDRILTKKFVVDLEDEPVAVNGSGEKPNPLLAEMNKKYDLDRQVKSTPVPIQWASDEHNLVAKKPCMTLEELENQQGEIEIEEASGSFFNFFSYEEDRYQLHTHLLELHSKALDLYAGVVEAANETFGFSDEDSDEEDGDPNQVVDLESESNDEPKKKKAKVSSA
ncbi:hypothetical protein PTTG_02090 [Puccinia triticina 1-1 BBBD Race 1]|uniref:Nucleosome assembly protein n=2 Tax=Puccinia triticina TaxID=208348 RepID=A0A0C4EMV0_PUCT1|nr:uncharacterized protein PtA15_5A289 [Puccinia triticina]OAV96067.1 hypothetical protein PTTG_02090 [Puccinia triticina 1-1 BBBD Race 1]WAQ84716.1 hypothetical protein PtA15_5A289 [Puccinia triticina]WAR58061.1 hypothetical protein PtB15_5B293 [Puccinia triticina]